MGIEFFAIICYDKKDRSTGRLRPYRPVPSVSIPVCAMMKFVNLFYRLPMEFIAQSFFMLAVVYLCARHRFAQRRWFRRGLWAGLALWVAAALWITTFSRSFGTVYQPELIPFHSYREWIASGSEEILRTNFMNVALFFPAGLMAASLLPDHMPPRRKLLLTGAVFCLFSLGIECLQFVCTLGQPEIDDVIHNTLGSLCGTLPILLRKLLYDPEK